MTDHNNEDSFSETLSIHHASLWKRIRGLDIIMKKQTKSLRFIMLYTDVKNLKYGQIF